MIYILLALLAILFVVYTSNPLVDRHGLLCWGRWHQIGDNTYRCARCKNIRVHTS